jgi:hypothetical protein
VIAAAADPAQRVQQMYTQAFARAADQSELASILSFVSRQNSRSEPTVWADVAHVLFNSAEFIYVQ